MFACVGITTTDLFNSGIERMPEFGGNEFTVNNLAFCNNPLQLVLGGNGAIAAHALARLGAPVTLCGAVGQDQLGDLIEGWLAESGVDTSGLLHSADAATPTTTVMTDAALNRVSFHHPGTSHIYRPEDFPLELLNNCSGLLLSSFTLLPKWRTDGFVSVAAAAKERDVATVLDIGPAIGEVAVLDELTALLPYIDYFICNEHEICTCIGKDNLLVAMQKTLDAGAKTAIVKQGERGAVILGRGDAELRRVPGFAVDAHFTVGAGDSFNAGFMYATARGDQTTEAVRFANAVAAMVVSAAKGSLGAPTLAEVKSFLTNQ